MFYLTDDFHAVTYGFLVHGDEVMVTLGQGLVQALHHILNAHDGAYLDEFAKQKHIENLAVVHLGGLAHGLDAIHVDVLAKGWVENAGGVVDERATGLYEWHETIQRGLVQHDGRVVGVQYGRGDAAVGEYDGDVGRTATLLWAIVSCVFCGQIYWLYALCVWQSEGVGTMG